MFPICCPYFRPMLQSFPMKSCARRTWGISFGVEEATGSFEKTMGMIWVIYLVGGFNHVEKYYSLGRIIPYIMKKQTCLKPPNSYTNSLFKNWTNDA